MSEAALENFLQALTAGLLVGCIYGLTCVGLGLISGIMRVINFAQGEFLMLGMYLTLGLALIIANGALIVFGSTPQSVRNPLSASAWQIGLPFSDSATVFVNKARSIASVISIAVTLALYWFIGRSRLGKALRAAADHPEAATYMGIDVDRAHRYAFAIGTGVTAIAGGLVANYYPFQPYVGLEFVIIMYAGVVLGGMGSLLGAFWGGMTIGLVQQMSSLVMSVQLQNVAIFVVFLLIVLLRPQCLYGRSAERT